MIRRISSEEPCFVWAATQSITLRVAGLAQHSTGPPLRNLLPPQTTTHFRDRASASFGAHQFPLAASRKISMSSAWFATSFFEPGVLLLKSLQLFGHLRRHPAVLLTPTIIRLLRDLENFTDFRHLLALAKLDVRTTQLPNNLIH